MKLYDLRVEYRKEPVGLAVREPRFSWKISSDEKNVLQTVYQIRVTDGERIVWNSHRRESRDSVLIPYEGEALQEERRYQVAIVSEGV